MAHNDVILIKYINLTEQNLYNICYFFAKLKTEIKTILTIFPNIRLAC